MELRISERAKNYPPSGIRKMFDLATQYPDAIKLTVGEPNFDTPEYIKKAAKEAIDAGRTHYAPNSGIDELRQSVANKYKSYWEGYTKDHVIITVGAMEGLMLSMMAILNPGDEILVPDPCFPNYYGQASIVGAKAVPVPTYEKNEYRIQAEDIEKAITPHTKAILLNSPCNPTGAVLTREDVLAIAELVKKHDLWVLSDEPYDSIVYDGVQPFSIAEVPEVRDQVMVFNSFSKAYAMTGWRLGYACGPQPVISQMLKMHQFAIMCAPTVSQMAAVEAMRSCDEAIQEMRDEYNMRRRLMVDRLNKMGLTCFEPRGAFYVFPSIRITGMTSAEFCEALLHSKRVAVVPGDAFGACGEGHVRISYSYSMEHLTEALHRIEAFLKERGIHA